MLKIWINDVKKEDAELELQIISRQSKWSWRAIYYIGQSRDGDDKKVGIYCDVPKGKEMEVLGRK